ncbi:MAG: ribonuclease III [Candidatus Saganbacteria bacterium]|nr:ribonuclease III [Candidatus Saganbacteria bacterium]
MIPQERLEQLKNLEEKISLSFLNKALLNQSLTHSSYANEYLGSPEHSNERLEFLGDAVLKLVSSEYLFNKFPQKQEGELTKIRSSAVSDLTLASVGRHLELGEYVLLGSNEIRTGGRRRRSNVANALEALIGAIYLDAGIGKARDFIVEAINNEVEKVSQEGFIRDYKSTLQEITQKEKWGLPQYKVIKETGPRHKRVFCIQVKVKNKILGTGRGGSKKEAQQRAASSAYRNLQKEQKEKEAPPSEKQGGIGKILRNVGKRMSFRPRRKSSGKENPR